ncbi:MAG: MgtC/SapB family protein [Candidatus Helarchaeota archaeon]|nr:MgtC/SapB family protein [Candidatus Helarchaeota archaeon]
MESLLDTTIKIFFSIVLGGLVGLEREIKQKPAGLRTNILICLGSTIIMIVSLNLSKVYGSIVDPSRIAAQVVTGIGFIGAGAIIRARGSVYGLTTAATIWVIAGIGLAIGNGYYLAALITTFVIMIILNLGTKLEKRFKPIEDKKRYTIISVNTESVFNAIENIINISPLEMEEMKIEKFNNKIRFHIAFKGKSEIQKEFLEKMIKTEGIEEVNLL